MRKFFLIPLMTLVCSVMAYAGNVAKIGNTEYATLQAAIDAASANQTVELIDNVTLTNFVNIDKSITLDGHGFTISGHGTGNLGSQDKRIVLAINYDACINTAKTGKTAEEQEAAALKTLSVTLKDLNILYTSNSTRVYGIVAYDGVASLAMNNVKVENNLGSGDFIAFCATGSKTTAMNWTMVNSTLKTHKSAYPAYLLKPLNATLNNSTIEGWCGLYFKYQHDVYGATCGMRGSVVTCDACTFNCANQLSGASNNFAIFPFEEDGITLNLNNCSFNAATLGNTYQRFVNLQYWKRGGDANDEATAQDITINITGDNTHLYNVTADKVAFNAWSMKQQGPNDGANNDTKVTATLNFNISGGTFTFDPTLVHWVLASDGIERVNDYVGGSGAITIPSTHEVQEANQGGKTVYRVVKKAQEKTPGVMYDLNDLVTGEGIEEGNNPVSSFDLSTGEEMKLNQETTTAGYVQVSDNGDDATIIKVGKVVSEAKVDQTLVINNGLDVQGDSKVEVQAGSALIIGEGGIVTSKPENIVIEADKDGAATLLMDPAIKVNQTPELTVKMVAQNVGKIGSDYYWHRFALPVDEVNAEDGSWAKDGHSYGTLLYKWDYENNEWASLTNVNQMQPFYGYTMTITEEVAGPGDLKDAGYIFKGKLTGNVNSVLNFSRQGYNFFGNSYTGYISIVQLIEELIGNENLDGTVWMWNSNRQQYEGIALNDLRDNPTAGRYSNANSWKKEVAPMQTFILRLMTTDTDTKANIDYATAVWGNPRYEDITGVTPAPARRVQRTEDAYVRIVVSAANGKADAINFQEDANLSDANDRGYDAAKYMNERTINVYSTIDGENFGTIATDNLEGKKLTINTIDEIAYTISFEDVEGNAYALRDNVTGAIFAIEEGATYEFTAQPNSIVEGRFEIVAIANVPTAIENTEVKANVKGIYTIMGQYLGEDFDILPAGVYVVNGVKIVK